MCGIAGAWNLSGKPIDPETITAMRDRLLTRGPDDAGLWVDGAIGLGHRRLSIIDLSPLGRQPMVDEATGNVISYNGEVYNYRELRAELEAQQISFTSTSDTEVILKAYRHWGRDCVTRFIGMFAIAIWDARERALWLARDRIGIKPLYYHCSPDTVLFASRLKALLAHPACPREIDPEAEGLYLDAGFVPAPWSILRGVRKLEPGHSLWITQGGASDHCYWDLDALEVDTSLESVPETELVDRLDRHIRDAVSARLVSDVPLGAFLSGGIDSTTVVAVMSHLGQAPDTFTVGFEEAEYSEASHARSIANHLGTNHHERIMRSEDLLGVIDTIVEHYDEPFADYSNLPTTLVSQFAREHVTVALSGDGGDELFAGYDQYQIHAGLRGAFALPSPLRSVLAKTIGLAPGHRYALLQACLRQPTHVHSFAFIRGMIKDFDRSTLVADDSAPTLGSLFEERRRKFSRLDPMSEACRLDAAYYLPDDILQKVDVASMSTSLEARVPLLDHRIVEFSQALPIDFKRRERQGKWLLRQVLARYVPNEMFDRPKSGFRVPIREWFRNELKPMLLDELAPSRVQALSTLDPAGVQRLVDLHLSGERDTHPMLWVLLSLLRWKERLDSEW